MRPWLSAFVYYYVMFYSTSCPHSMMWESNFKGLTTKIVFYSNNSRQHLTTVFGSTCQTIGPDQEPKQVFIPFLLMLFTLTSFLFSDLSIQNRHFHSSLSVHFAWIGIRMVSMFWVISSSVLYNPLPDLQTHWPLSSLREISAAKQFCSFSRTKFFPGLNGREPCHDQVSWVINTFVFINMKVKPTRANRTWPHLAGPRVTWSRQNLELCT